MYRVYEVFPGGRELLGMHTSIQGAMLRAAHAITDGTDGAVDHVNNLQCIAQYLAVTGFTLELDYVEAARIDPIAAYKLP